MIRIAISDYDPRWPDTFQKHAAAIAAELGDAALSIEHIGSTSVPGLAAKPIIDILVVVRDSGDEESYLSGLQSAGYELRVREPQWHRHRMFRTAERDVHVHVFSRGCVEVRRVLAFRDRLRSSPENRRVYEETKRNLARSPWPNLDAYARAKTDVIERIIAE